MKIQSTTKMRLVTGLAASFMMSALTACGGGAGGFVKNVTLGTTTVGSDQVIDLKLDLNTFNLVLPGFDLPIGGASHVGDVKMVSGLGGASIDITADVQKILHFQGQDGHFLPNGNPIPVMGLDTTPVVATKMANGSTVYFSYSASHLMVGISVPIAQLAQLGQYSALLGGLNYFPTFKFGNVVGVAGIYTGAMGNGLAFFIDASSLLVHPAVGPMMRTMSVQSAGIVPSAKPDYSGTDVDGNTKSDLEGALYQLGEDQNGEPLTTD